MDRQEKAEFMAEENHGSLEADMAAANGSDNGPTVGIINQYIKDMSVENPNAPESHQWEQQPQIDVQFNIGSRSFGDEMHEVELKINVTAKAEQGTAFIVELAYAAMVGMRNVPEDQAHAFLFGEAPRIIFPFARRILADAVRDAGFPPLMLEPMDFNTLYLQQLAQKQAAEAGEQPAGNA